MGTLAHRALRRIGRLARYVVVGGCVAAFYSALVFCLVTTGQVSDPVLASALATLITQPLAFFLHRAVTYADVERHNRQVSRFAVVAVTSLVVGVGTMKAVSLLAWPFWVALIIGWFLVPIANYLVSTLWVFEARSLLALNRAEEKHSPGDIAP